jgi:hypothetical protein
MSPSIHAGARHSRCYCTHCDSASCSDSQCSSCSHGLSVPATQGQGTKYQVSSTARKRSLRSSVHLLTFAALQLTAATATAEAQHHTGMAVVNAVHAMYMVPIQKFLNLSCPWCIPSLPHSGGRCFLHVRLLKGLAFTDYVVRDPLPGEQLQLSLELFGQR